VGELWSAIERWLFTDNSPTKFLELLHMVFISIAFVHGLGQHFQELSPADQQTALFYQIGFIELFAVTPCMFGRISFAVFLLYLLVSCVNRQDEVQKSRSGLMHELQGGTAKWKRTILWTVIVIQIVINLIVVIQIYAQCGSHFNALWNADVREIATCQPPTVETYIGYVQSGLNSLCDITLTTIPAFILWNLQMPRREKITLACVLMLSIFAFAASLVKAVEIKNLTETMDFTCKSGPSFYPKVSSELILTCQGSWPISNSGYASRTTLS
jgi:hypothetical protein